MKTKFSDFKIIHEWNVWPLQTDSSAVAEVNVTETTGFLWFRKTTTRKALIYKELFGTWFFMDGGATCPMEIGELCRAYRAKEKAKEIEWTIRRQREKYEHEKNNGSR